MRVGPVCGGIGVVVAWARGVGVRGVRALRTTLGEVTRLRDRGRGLHRRLRCCGGEGVDKQRGRGTG